MSYGIILTIAGSIADYDRMHEATMTHTGGDLEGLLLHIGRETGDGFQIIEVWDTKEHSERGNREVLWPLFAAMGPDAPSFQPVAEEFDPRGLILNGARVAL